MVQDKKLFIGLFSGFKDEAQDMGYAGGFETELFNEMLLNHFGLEIEDEQQLIRITRKVIDLHDLEILNNFTRAV